MCIRDSLCSLRKTLVSLLHAQAGRASCEYLVRSEESREGLTSKHNERVDVGSVVYPRSDPDRGRDLHHRVCAVVVWDRCARRRSCGIYWDRQFGYPVSDLCNYLDLANGGLADDLYQLFFTR